MATQKQEKKPVNIEVKGEIDLPQIDHKKYIGVKTNIQSADTYESKNFGGGYYVLLTTESIDIVGGKAVYATRILGLQQDEQGNIGWGKETNMARYLAEQGVNHFKELVGKEVIVQTRTDKEGNTFLTF